MERVETGWNGVPAMFNAGISNKFTKRHGGNYHDTTLSGASAAKVRAEKKLERQASAIEKQQQKIETEMRKVEELAERLRRQQIREAKRLRSRLQFAAGIIQRAYRHHSSRIAVKQREAAVNVQRVWRGVLGRRYYAALEYDAIVEMEDHAASVIARSTRMFACRRWRQREHRAQSTAACAIQGGFRILVARACVSKLRQQRKAQLQRDYAAVVIQSNARCFMTRLIYLDVLFLVCRIQAVARGYLTRRWLRRQQALAVAETAVVKLQALGRGFCVRNARRERLQQCSRAVTPPTSALPRQPDPTPSCDVKLLLTKAKEITPRSHTKSSTPPATTELPPVKRSYWLPSGSSFNRRLPVVLPPAVAGGTPKASTTATSSNDDLELLSNVPRSVPRRRPHSRPRPGKLSPVNADAGIGDKHSTKGPHTRDDTSAAIAEEEDRRRRAREEQEQLRMKQRAVEDRVARREKQRQLQEEQSRRDVEEREERERGQMEREDRSMRLHVKLLQRRSREGRVRRQTVEQQREERERIAMAREERHTRLCLKRRRVLPKSVTVLTPEGSAQPRATDAPRQTTNGMPTNIPSYTNHIAKTRKSQPRRRKQQDPEADSPPRESRRKHRDQHVAKSNQQSTGSLPRASTSAITCDKESDDEGGVDYGDEFDDMVDEAQLAIC